MNSNLNRITLIDFSNNNISPTITKNKKWIQRGYITFLTCAQFALSARLNDGSGKRWEMWEMAGNGEIASKKNA